MKTIRKLSVFEDLQLLDLLNVLSDGSPTPQSVSQAGFHADEKYHVSDVDWLLRI